MLAALLCNNEQPVKGGPQWSDLKPSHPNYRRQQLEDIDKFLLEQIKNDQKRDRVDLESTEKVVRQRVKPGKMSTASGEIARTQEFLQSSSDTTIAEPVAPYSQTVLRSLEQKVWQDRKAEILAEREAFLERQQDDEQGLILILLAIE